MLSIRNCSLLALILSVFVFQQKLAAKKINTKNLSKYTELTLVSAENESLQAFLLIDDLAKSLTAGTRTNLNFFIPNKNKRVFKYILNQADGTFVSEVNLKRKRFSLPSSIYEVSTNETLSLKVIDNKSRENVYSFTVQFNIDDLGDNPDNGSDNVVVDKSLFNRCFKSGKAENYDKCLELFFNNVSFSNEEGDVATVVNDSGNFLVNLPKASVNETAIENFFSGLADDSALLTKITGPAGAQGERGLQGPAGDSIWSIENTNKVTNNGSQGNQATQDLVFGDSTIEGNNQTKLAFEKSTGALRIGSTDNGQWLNRGRFSVIIGQNSSAAFENGAVTIGSGNSISGDFVDHNNQPVTNSISRSFVIGDRNVSNHPFRKILGFENNVSGKFYGDIIGDQNTIISLGDYPKTKLSSLMVKGNHNQIKVEPRGLEVIGNSNLINGVDNGISLVGYGILENVYIHGTANELDFETESDDYVNGDVSTGNTQIYGYRNYFLNKDSLDFTSVFGRINTVQADGSVIYGQFNQAINQSNSLAYGEYIINNGANAFTIGSGVTGGSGLEGLRNNYTESMVLGVRSIKPAIVITASGASTTTTGNVAIGDMTPQRKLHISEAMRIEPQSSPPGSPSLGDIYVDDSEAVCVYASGAWSKIAGAGSCT